jgi:ABC-type sugar transport system ATPase subunit
MARIELKGLSKSFGPAAVIERLDLSVDEGEYFCLAGPSGCGKSTLLNIVAGLEAPSSGSVLFDGADVTSKSPRERDVALVFQDYALYPHMTAKENIAFPLKVRGMRGAELARRVEETAELLGLRPLLERRPKELSGGQQQRVALGRALIRRPRVFLLDEPLSNLDARLRSQMRLELKRLHRDFKITTVHVTHDQEEALSLADRLALLEGGKLRQLGTPQEIYERPADLFVARFVGRPEMNVLDAALEKEGLRLPGGLVAIDARRRAALEREGGRARAGIRPDDVVLADEGLPARVELVEPMGGETWLELSLAGVRLLAKIQGRSPAAPGSEVRLRLAPDRLHLFRVSDGRSIRDA